jgi:radical SAM superfamily enzyme YgiQ (UPF0313 family)
MPRRRPQDYAMEIGPMGPIGEGKALLLRVSRNCPWNQCLFCPVYKGEKFASRGVSEIKSDIDAVRRVCDLIQGLPGGIGLGGAIKKGVRETLIRSHPEIYGDPGDVTKEEWFALQSLNLIANWLKHGAKRVFLQDANALSMKTRDLVEILQSLKKSFPTIDTVTCYARSRTCEQKSAEELQELKDAGLSWCFVGVESGCDGVLDYMKKGVKKREHIAGGQKVMDSGIQMAAFVMPGLGGRHKELAKEHLLDTTAVLNEVRPTEVRMRSLAVLQSTPLYEKWESGEFEAPSEEQMIEELRMLIEGLTFDCTVETFQLTNVFTVKGRLFEERDSLVNRIRLYQALSPVERARFLLNRYLYGGYLAFVESWGEYDVILQAMIEEAETSLEEGSNDAMQKVERAIFSIKSRGIP